MEKHQPVFKNEKELETLTQAIKIYWQDKGMVFRIEKYAMHIVKSVKRQITEGREGSNQEKTRTLRKKAHYPFLVADTIQQAEMKKTIRKLQIRRTRNFLETTE